MQMFQYTGEELTALTNKALDNYLEVLRREKVLTEDQHRQLSSYRVMFVARGFLGHVWDAIWKRSDSASWRITVVRVPEAERRPMNEGESDDESKG